MEDVLSKAVIKIKSKLIPKDIVSNTTPGPAYERLYPILEVFDIDTVDNDIQKKAQFIYEYIEEHGGADNMRDSIMHILTKLGATPYNETRIGRIYNYCKLRKKSDAIMKEYEYVQKEINAISDSGRE